MQDFIGNLIDGGQYVAILFLTMLLPAEAVMPLAGFVSSSGDLSLLGAIIAGVIGSTLGSTAIYLAARYLIDIKRLGLSTASIERAGKWFDRHARMTVMFGRLVPGVRSAVSVPAGLRKMPFWQFVAYTALGNCLWITVLAVLGYSAPAVQSAYLQATALQNTIVAAFGLIILIALWMWYHHRRGHRS